MLIKKKSYNYYWFFIISLILLGIAFYLFGFNDSKCIKYSYYEDNVIDYKVYLKENAFFETKYLGKDKTYITSLIDYLALKFDYNIRFNEYVSGKLKYNIVATISAEKNNNQIGSYWEKTFMLTEPKYYIIENKKEISIVENIDIDYQKYNELLTSFVETYKISSDGFLKVSLIVDGDPKITPNDTLPVSNEISLKIPLSKIAVEAEINTNSNNKEKEITRTIRDNDSKYIVFKILFLIDVLLIIYLLFRYFYHIARNRKLSSYNDNVQKIINDYSSIMVRTSTLNLKTLNRIKVSSFDDLLVVYNDVRTPIHYLEKKGKTEFIIIFEKMAWIYTILEEDYEDYEEDFFEE